MLKEFFIHHRLVFIQNTTKKIQIIQTALRIVPIPLFRIANMVGKNSSANVYIYLFITLVQIRVLKNLYFGQQNDQMCRVISSTQ